VRVADRLAKRKRESRRFGFFCGSTSGLEQMMGKRGPKPAPNHLKVLRGDREQYLNRDEPIPTAVPGVDLTKPPRGIGAPAARVWRRLAPDLVDKGMLTAWDVDLFGAYCDTVATYEDVRRQLRAVGVTAKGSVPGTAVKHPLWRVQADCLATMVRLGAKFGLSPADRADVTPSDPRAPRLLGPERLLD
jgi:P27 family predicted phage terminase small subunit